jgi:hypothetical protein
MTTSIPRPDRLMLVSLFGSGFGWLLLLSPPWSGGFTLFLTCGAYVVAGSAAMAAAHGREPDQIAGERMVLFGLWLAAVLLWAVIVLMVSSSSVISPRELCGCLAFGLLIGTPCFAVWQVVAYALRGAWRWRSGMPDEAADPWRSA